MRPLLPRVSRGIALPTVLCSLVCGGAVAAMAVTGLLAIDGAEAAPVARPAVRPPAAVVVPAAVAPAVTAAPTAPEWTVTLPPAGR
jgi:hypothetical protein